MEEKDKIHICVDCKSELNDGVSVCPYCGCPVSKESSNNSSQINKKTKYIGIALCIVSIICFIFGIGKITDDDYSFYVEHRNECQDNLKEVQEIADSYTYGFFKSSYQDIADTYIDMIKKDQEKIWTYRIEAIVSCSLGAILLVLGINKTKFKGE